MYLNDNNAGSLHALDAATSEPIWSLSIGYATGGSPSLSPDGLIMPAGGGRAAVVAVADRGDHGEVTWRQEAWLNRGVSTQAAGDRAYVTVNRADQQNDLVVVDTATGDELDREALPGDTGFTVGTTPRPRRHRVRADDPGPALRLPPDRQHVEALARGWLRSPPRRRAGRRTFTFGLHIRRWDHARPELRPGPSDRVVLAGVESAASGPGQ